MNTNLIIHNSLIIVLSIFIILVPKLNKFKLSLLFENIFVKLLFILLIFFSLIENYLVGILLIILYFSIKMINSKQINEGFLNYYEKKI